ncbi:MAG: hypothetical protein IBJ10_11160 [Phycisphaerales bacterium]|nr:hypothetical protein [Phycisphaerales bacterium]
MAKDKPSGAAPAPADAAPAKKKLPLVPIIGVLALLVVEGVVIFIVVGGAGKPAETHGAELHEAHLSEADKLVEILVVKDKFPNSSTGRSWIWDVEIQVQVKSKNLGKVQEVLASRSAEIKTGLARIWRTAQHNYFNEPSLETLTRQVKGLLDDIMSEGTAKYAVAAPVAAPAGDGHGGGGDHGGGGHGPAPSGGGHASGEPAIERVLIPRCVGFPTDY